MLRGPALVLGNSALPTLLDLQQTYSSHVGPRTTKSQRYAKRRSLYCDGELSPGLDLKNSRFRARAECAAATRDTVTDGARDIKGQGPGLVNVLCGSAHNDPFFSRRHARIGRSPDSAVT